MSKRNETTRFFLFEFLAVIFAIIIFSIAWKFDNTREIYVDDEARTASQVARNTITAQRYLPAVIQWHMESQAKIDNGYFEKGTLDYDCSETGWKLKHMECPVSGVDYSLTYSPEGRVMHFEWDYSKEES